MKKLLLLLVAVGSCLFAAAQTKNDARSRIPEDINPWSAQRQFDMNLLKELIPEGAVKGKSKVEQPRKAMKRADGLAVDTVDYFAVAQSYYKSYTFTYEGGDILTYDLGIAVDGTKVTFKNLFNLYDPNETYYTNSEYPVSGTYDPEAKTITIPTSTVFANATVVGEIMGYYTGVLVSGTVDEEGTVSPDDNLVFHVEGDFDKIYTDQAFGVSEYTPDGSTSYGIYKFYKSFQVVKPKAGAELIKFNDIIDYGEIFPNTEVTKSVTIVNVGSDAADYVVGMESDDNSFTVDSESGTIPGHGSKELSFTFSTDKVGDYEGLATLEYEGGDPMLVQMIGTIKPFPDFSKIVKNGDFTFTTNNDYPFDITQLEDGTTVARSTTNGNSGSSKLTVTFNVPEGKLGKLSWKGKSNNIHYWYYAAGGVFIDDMNTAAYTYDGADEDVSNTVELQPGDHTVRFQFDQSYYTGDPTEGMYVYDLDLQTEELKADSAVLNTDALDMGNFIIENGSATGTGYVEFVNKGANDLTLKSATSDNAEITVDTNVDPAKTLGKLSVPVILNAKTAGKKEAKVTLVTSAGTYTIPVTADVMDMPDFKSIVTEGADLMTFSTNAQHPFIVEDGKAYNKSSQVVDYTPVQSSFKVKFTIPEGKLGYLSWKGRAWGTPMSEPNYYSRDYGMISMTHPKNSGTKKVWGNDCDAGSDSTFLNNELWADYLACVPGDHEVEFYYVQGGDSTYFGKDRLEISDFALHLIDFVDDNAELIDNSVTFDSTYVGPNRYTKASVKLRNLGNNNLKVLSVNNVGPFYGIVPEDSAAFNKTLEVELWFYPSAEGDYKDSLTISTTAGDFKVECKGSTRSMDGIVYAGDFEDDAYGWTVYDGNNDGETWNLGTNLWGEVSSYVHSGIQCLASISYSNYLGSITPDNWTFSPAITVPADGATLTYYVAAFHPDRYAEHYSLYITDNMPDVNSLNTLVPVYEETLTEENGAMDGWSLRKVDLTPYAGKTVYLLFRHHDCTGQYILRLDDVFVYNKGSEPTAIGGVVSEGNGEIVSQKFYNASGVKLDRMQKGLNIVSTYYSDGTVKTEKIFNK